MRVKDLPQFHATCFLAVGLALGATCMSPANGQESDKPADSSAAVPEAPPADAEDLADPAFDRYVNILLLGKAWDEMDAGLLVDVGLQLAEGERVLQRCHRAIGARKLLELATYVAVETHDKTALERLAKVAKNRDDQELQNRVAMANKLAGQSRGPELGASVSMSQVGSSEFALFRSLLVEIRAARIAQDSANFDQIAERIALEPELSSLSREKLQKAIQQARAGVPEQTGVEDSIRRILGKLQDAHRAGLLGFYVVPDRRGMLITNFIPGTSADQLHQDGELQVGDVVRALAGRPIYRVQDIYQITDRTPAGAPLRMEMLTRYNEPYWIWITPSGGGGVAACEPGCGRPVAGGEGPGFGEGPEPAAPAYGRPGRGGFPGDAGFPAAVDPAGPMPARVDRAVPRRPEAAGRPRR